MGNVLHAGSAAIVTAPVAAKTVIVAVWFAGLFLAERLIPADRVSPAKIARPWGRLGRNAALWTLNIVLAVAIVVPVTRFAADHAFAWRPAWWTGTPGLFLDLVLLDFLIYWWHRATHQVDFLWRFHEVHHLDRTLDTTSAVRFHFGEVALAAVARALVVVAIGFQFASVVAFETLVLVATLFHHSNLRLPRKFERLLSFVVITPSIHWVHHHAVRRDTDSNYGTVFSFWDPLFRTRNWTQRAAGMTIGVEGKDEEPLLALLTHPARTEATRRR